MQCYEGNEKRHAYHLINPGISFFYINYLKSSYSPFDSIGSTG